MTPPLFLRRGALSISASAAYGRVASIVGVSSIEYYYPLDDAAPSATAREYSGGTNGVYSGTPTLGVDAPDYFDGATRFNGGSDKLETPQKDVYTDQFTVLGWYKSNDSDNTAHGAEGIFTPTDSLSAQDIGGVHISATSGAEGVVWLPRNSGGGNGVDGLTKLGQTDIVDQQWHFIAWSVDGVAREQRCYVDGVKEATLDYSTITDTQTALMQVGRGYFKNLEGDLSGFFVINRILSDTEVADVYTALGGVIVESFLVTSGGDFIVDSSGNNIKV